MGIRSAHAFEVSFDQLFVPLNCRLGEEGSGFKTAMKVMNNSRLDVAENHWAWRRKHWKRP
jgi:alkylation response protein AidB-like acyl-CoA dehydrogenase